MHDFRCQLKHVLSKRTTNYEIIILQLSCCKTQCKPQGVQQLLVEHWNFS